jgi:GntR family transcriptional regulator
VADDLRRQIVEGVFPPGARLPSEHALAEQHGVARGTIRQALSSLRSEGAIASRRGARGVVLAPPRAQSFEHLLSFSAWALALGEKPSGRVVELSRRDADAVDAERLGIEIGSTVYDLVRVRLLSHVPVMVERTTFTETPGALLGGLRLDHDSIYERLAEHGVVFARARHTIDAVVADSEDALLLNVGEGVPLLRQRRRTTSPVGEPLEWSDDRYLGSAVSFVVDNTASSAPLGRTLRLKEGDNGSR